MTAQELKQTLSDLKNSDWKLDTVSDPFKLAIESVNQISSTDPVLRDELITDYLYYVITANILNTNQKKEILNNFLCDKHLFSGLGEQNTDTVFNRTFSVLLVAILLGNNNEKDMDYFSKEDITHTFKCVIEYASKEIDYRGYVQDKGWAHSSAHTADCLAELALSKYIQKQELQLLLDVIKNKICINTYAYINREEERLLVVLENICKRNVFSSDEIQKWLLSFLDVTQDCLPQKEFLRHNRKLFFRAIYFKMDNLLLDEKTKLLVTDILTKDQFK